MIQTKNQSWLSIFWQMIRKSLAEIRRNDPMRMAGATAFFTTFALPPIFIILFQLFSLFLSKKVVATEMMEILSETLGKASALQIRQTTRGFGTLARNWFIASAGFVFLLFVATTLFSVIKNSLNDIWQIKVKERPGTLFKLKVRAKSLAIILVAGLLFMGAIFLDSFEILARDYMKTIFPGGGGFFKGVLDEVVSIIVISIWFIVLFR
jgi:membrane protein